MKLEWQDICAICVIIAICSVQLLFFSEFKQLPGPIYGGDVYYHLGHINHIYRGGSVFDSSQFLGEYEPYPWFSHLLVAVFAWAGGLTTINAFIYFPILMTILSGAIIYYFSCKYFKEKIYALLLMSIWITNSIFIFVPTYFALVVMVPLLYFTIFNSNDLKSTIFAGIIWGLSGIQHLTAFLIGGVLIGLLFLFRILREHVQFKNNKLEITNKNLIAKTIIAQSQFFLPMIVIGSVIAMVCYWPAFFVYHFKTLNPWQEYTFMGTDPLMVLSLAFSELSSIFLNFSNVRNILFSLLAIFGMYASIKLDIKLPIFALLTSLIGFIHPFITMPILGTSFGYYRFGIGLTLVQALAICIGLYYLSTKSKNLVLVGFIVFIVLIVLNFYNAITIFKQDRWTQVGYEYPSSFDAAVKMANFITNNTQSNDVFISTHGETAFALNALSGSKVVYLRRTHASPYVDIDKRIADAAVILYGDDRDKANELMKEYNINYLYEDAYSIQSEAACLQDWSRYDDAKFSDSSYSCLQVSPAYEEYLKKAGIDTKKVYVRLDPASDISPKYDMLIIKPSAMKLKLQILQAFEYVKLSRIIK